MKYKLMIVEDDPGIADAIAKQAEMWEMEVHIQQNYRDVLTDFTAFQPHILLLDIALPYFNGYHWCSEIRKLSKLPIIFISSAGDNMNIIMAMNLGADDFVVKPFDLSVLMAKIQALLRRSYDFTAGMPLLAHRDAVLNTGDASLHYRNTQIPLTRNEYQILLCLLENKGRVVSREKLMERIWKTNQFVDENTLTVNVNRLRKKLDSAGLHDFINTKFGLGYIVE